MDLIFLNGAMGAGKTATARALQKMLPPCAMADGDDLWNMYPFAVNDTTKAMVLSNIGHVLNSYLQSGLFSSTIFSWVMHEESIVQDILLRLPPPYGYRFFLFTLECPDKTRRARLEADAAKGLRPGGLLLRGTIARGEKRAEQCGAMLSFKLPTEGCSPEETAERIRRIVNGEEHPLPYRRTKQLGKDERALRKEVFMDEQGFAGEFDEADERATHLVFYNGGEPAACCRIFPGGKPGEYVLGRLAVKKPLRGKGVGAYAVRAAEESARLCGGREMVLSAQVRAQGFYERCGYAAAGEVFPEEGVPHVRMRKKL